MVNFSSFIFRMAEAIPYESTEKSEEAVATENKDGDIGMESSTTTDLRLVWLFDSSDARLMKQQHGFELCKQRL